MNCNAHLTDIMYEAVLHTIPVGLFDSESMPIGTKWIAK